MFKRTLKIMSIIVLSMVIFSGQASAGDTASQTVTISVSEISDISVSGSPAPMVLNALQAGSQEYVPVVDNSTTYTVINNLSDMQITAALDAPMPNNLSLTMGILDPLAGITVPKLISEVAVEMAYLGRRALYDGEVIFELNGDINADPQAFTRVVTLTLTSSI